ncbi:MAG: 3-methyl-2-oxobutanoate hydroxymethyltransferase [Nitrospinota bacterium]
MERKKLTISDIQRLKRNGRRIASVTAYDYAFAKIVDAAGVDIILVGDSLGMVMLGYRDTTRVSLEAMLHHTRAVAQAEPKALLVGDMPFLSYGVSRAETIRNAGRFLQEAGAQAVKLEGGLRVQDEIKALVDREVPVMGHIGLTPQSIHRFGGYKVQGKDPEAADALFRDALAVQEAGAFSVVLECVPAPLARRVTEELRVPTIGIGAGPGCDGQVLVLHDILGLYGEISPKFAKVYAPLGSLAGEAIAAFVREVREGQFPGPEHSF